MLKKWIAHVCPCCTTNTEEHEFKTLQEAVDWVGLDEEGMIILCHNLINVPKIKISSQKIIKITGQNEYGITFVDDLLDETASIGANQTLKFTDLSHATCENIIIDANNANFEMNNCKKVTATLKLTSGTGTNVDIVNSDLTGFGTHPAIEVDNLNTEIKISDSIVQGSSTKPAILFSVASDQKLKIKNSLILHGSDGFPILNDGDFKNGIYVYNCISNKRLDNEQIYNYINNDNNNIINSDITF